MRIPILGIELFGSGDDGTDIDSVCGMKVLKSNPPAGASRHEGQTYVFCGHQCKDRFDADSAK
ncbi:MAG: YHS domain-containing protein [Chloroflexi bacterium]|nr:YHS domain-containing protein [Chloroflexota bacterium]